MSGILAAAAAVTLVYSLGGSPADAARIKAGTLTCTLAPSVGLVVGSRQTMTCRFVPGQPGPTEVYRGTITRVGLEGTYVGASIDAAIGVGLGANVLIGGFNRSVALQPLSVEGQAGVNLALGVADLQLTRIR